MAHWIGAHATALFVCAVALVLSVIVLLWWVAKEGFRYGSSLWARTTAHPWTVHLQGRFPRLHALLQQRTAGIGYLAIHLGIGLPIVLAALSLFVELADEIDPHGEIGAFDHALNEALRQSVSPTVLALFSVITELGDPRTLTLLGMAVAVLLMFRRRWVFALGWSAALAGNGVLNRSLKTVFQRVRPLHDHELIVAQGWSFPSGHSSGALVAYGMLAYLLVRALPRAWHLPIVIAAVTLILLVGFSRMFLQVHFFSDVIAGYASGTAWLAVCIAGTEIALAAQRRGSGQGGVRNKEV